jgi:sugar-specific transcriptional regulator TrmB
MLEENTLLAQIGLNQKEAEIYEIMLRLGKVPANKILPETDLKRTTVYSILDELTEKKLIVKDESAGLIQFRAKHPYALKEYLEGRVSDIKTTESKLDAVLPNFINAFHQSQNRPGVKYYEGKKGVWKMMKDTLTSKTTIDSIVDVEAVNKYIKDLNQKYVKLRNKAQIKKRLLVVDTPYAREHFKTTGPNTEVKFFKLNIKPFNTTIQTYDNTTAYITMSDKYLSSVIIDDPYIYSMHKAIFEFIWSTS